MTTIAYHTACGPRAVAAISGADVHDAAGQLASLTRKRGGAPPPTTSAEILELWLMLWGFAVEQWNVYIDREYDSAAAYRARLLAPDPPPVETLAPIVERVAASLPHIPREQIEGELARREAEIPKLADWIAAHPQDAWLCYVDDHVLAVWEGRVVAGDSADLRHYGSHRLIAASRVTRPSLGESPCP